MNHYATARLVREHQADLLRDAELARRARLARAAAHATGARAGDPSDPGGLLARLRRLLPHRRRVAGVAGQRA